MKYFNIPSIAARHISLVENDIVTIIIAGLYISHSLYVRLHLKKSIKSRCITQLLFMSMSTHWYWYIFLKCYVAVLENSIKECIPNNSIKECIPNNIIPISLLAQ